MTRKVFQLIFVLLLPGAAAARRSATASEVAGPKRVDVVIDARMGGYLTQVIRASRGDTVHVTLRAMDSAHGFRVQGTDVEVTAYPGIPAEVTFVADWLGGREWYCTFDCGPTHGQMSGMIVVTLAGRD